MNASTTNPVAPSFSLAQLFGFRQPVHRGKYAMVGIALSLAKYLVELAVIAWCCGMFYSPIDFVSPFLSSRERFLSSMPTWFGWAWLLWTLPFLWVGVGMSVRRAFDAGISPWFGLVILVPFVNLVGLLVLALLPTTPKTIPSATKGVAHVDEVPLAEVVADLYRPPMSEPSIPESSESAEWYTAVFLGIGAGAGYLVLSVVASVYLLNSYGAAMFFGAPIVTCAVSSYCLNWNRDRGFGATLVHSIMTLLVASLGFLAFGLEGGICIAMAVPIFIPVGLIGTIVGYTIAVNCRRPNHNERNGLFGCIVVLPLIAAIESAVDVSPVIESRSQVLIEAPIERVWRRVVDFPDIIAKPEGILSFGVAYPIRARIDGHGAGAIRYCEFNTGVFVEPITAWDEPYRLSFDVTSQPEPMSELSPYRHIHPPHLDGTFRSLRGEFRLFREADGTTRLEGSTWYQLDMGPRLYWRLWTDWIVHRIHVRVLEHVKEIAENDSIASPTISQQP
ncbi:MAG: hypothetical protein ABL921_15220 [Pirellula sp.]